VPEAGNSGRKELGAKKGEIPLWKPTSKGCPFAVRCPLVVDQCKDTFPQITQLSDNHFIRCHNIENT